MTIPTITTIIDPPLPTDAPAIFDQKAFAAWADLNTWADQANATAIQINTDADRVNDPAVQAVASNLVSIVAVANNKTNIDRVSANQANINVVSANDANIKTVSGISSQVTTVAGMKTTVEAVNNNKTNIDNVAGNKANIDNVAGNKTNINTVAGNSANVTTVASNISSVNTTAGNMAAVIDAPIQATKAQTQATLADGYRQQAAASSTTATSAAISASSSAGIAQTAAATAQAIVWQGTTGYPTIRPSLLLDFANSKAVDPRITFTRASTASYWDDKGMLRQALAGQPRIDHDPATGECKGLLIEESRTNLLKYSEQFDNAAWDKLRSTITPNSAIAPDGAMTAEKIVENAGADTHYITQAISFSTGTDYTFSVYLKPAERFSISLAFNGLAFGVPQRISVNLNTLNCTVVQGSPTFKVESVGDGWVKVSLTATAEATGGTQTLLYIQDSNSAVAYQGDGASGVYVWGAQLEAGSFPTSYIPTPATFTSRASVGRYFDADGEMQEAAINEARYDHGLVDGVWVPKGLLLEPQRTNLLTHSEQFDNAAWAKTQVIISANTAISPDDELTADKLIASSATAVRSAISSATAMTAGTTYTASCFAKSAEYSVVQMSFQAKTHGTNQWANFDLVSGTCSANGTGVSAAITPVGDGWYRCTYSAPATVSVSGGITFLPLPSFGFNRQPSYPGDGTSGIYIWGAQLEEIPAGKSPEPTSYIKTEATAVTRSADVSTSSAVTRAADSAVMTGENFSSWYNQSEGTVFVDAKLGEGQFPYAFYIGDGTDKNRHILYRYSASATKSIPHRVITTVGNVSQSASTNLSATASKFAYAYKEDDFSVSVAGVNAFNDISGSVPPANVLGIGCRSFLPLFSANGHIRKLAYYPKRLPNEQLQALTAE